MVSVEMFGPYCNGSTSCRAKWQPGRACFLGRDGGRISVDTLYSNLWVLAVLLLLVWPSLVKL